MEIKSMGFETLCEYCESSDKIIDCEGCSTNPDMAVKIAKFKAEMIKEAQAEHPERTVRPCSSRKSLWECFIIYDLDEGQVLCLSYNIGKGTHFSKKVLIHSAGSH